jgi:multiple sugar transport system substrate-binding protein
MTRYRGLTWDHPRGADALRRAAADLRGSGTGLEIEWDVQPLEGFESTPVPELARDYDLIVLDHPHLGEAIASHSLRPLDDLLGRETVHRLALETVGPAFESYRMGGRLWAAPLDVATQVSAYRRGSLPFLPETWDDVERLSHIVPVALSLGGPHALLSFLSASVAFGADPGRGGGRFVDRAVGARVLSLFHQLTRRAPRDSVDQNPITLLERLDSGDGIDYIPLVYGYVTYSGPGRSVRAADAPRASAGGRIGSTIGGTGIAVTRRSEPDAALLDHLGWLLSEPVQRGFLPDASGQPSARAAWTDPRLDDATDGFYRRTLQTVEQSWVRPRHEGYIRFQAEASALLREALVEPSPDVDATLDHLDDLYAGSLGVATTAPSGREPQLS